MDVQLHLRSTFLPNPTIASPQDTSPALPYSHPHATTSAPAPAPAFKPNLYNESTYPALDNSQHPSVPPLIPHSHLPIFPTPTKLPPASLPRRNRTIASKGSSMAGSMIVDQRQRQRHDDEDNNKNDNNITNNSNNNNEHE